MMHLQLLFLLVSIFLDFVQVQGTFITNDTSHLQKVYEYVIVGGGTTALAVANRLAVAHAVLVVEQGPDAMDNEAVNDPFTPFGTCVSVSAVDFNSVALTGSMHTNAARPHATFRWPPRLKLGRMVQHVRSRSYSQACLIHPCDPHHVLILTDTSDASGSCLGGGSSINALMGSRPTFAGMTALEALGNPGWGWNDFLP
jgi:choline dehydrogenase-like flavoprotein